MTTERDERVLVLAPTAADAALTESILAEAGISCASCRDIGELQRAIEDGAGAILLTDEVLSLHDSRPLTEQLRQQPAWSDLPVLMLCGARPSAQVQESTAAQFGNVTVLERPVRLTNLVSALRSAIAARRRQYQIREQLLALELAEEHLREADRRKDEFLAILAHELRNPLTPVRNAAHFLKLSEPSGSDAGRAIDMIERQTAQMARLIEDLLDVSRISRGQLTLRKERLEFASVAAAALDATRHEIEMRRHQLTVRMPEEPVTLEADRDRLVQVVSNLLANAARYTPPGGHIEFAAEERDGRLEILVRDNGIGIPPEKLTEIFELFAQVDRSFDRQGGLGIGLTLVRQLVDLHGGTVQARSEGLGRGSVFVISLPIAAEAVRPPPHDATAERKGAAPLRVLLADDNHDAAESLAMVLRGDAHDVRLAFDGESALRILREFRPQVALLDIAMPNRGGLEVARLIRDEPWGGDVLLIAITGWGRPEDRRAAAEAGFDAYLVKPTSPEAVTRLLAEQSAHLAARGLTLTRRLP